MSRLSFALVWHMHQPYYKDLITGEYVMPWARLHATKDYYDMAAILDKFPQAKMTFNLVPSLLDQLEDYCENEVSDKFLSLTKRDPGDLNVNERVFLLQNFFMANWETMIKPYPRYHELLLKRGRFIAGKEISSVARRFSSQEILDLQVWFNLTWFGFISKNEDSVVSGLIKKGKYFDAGDKEELIRKQKEIMLKVIPKYRELMERGQIELTTTPFYHPILPLLCDTDSALEAMPHARLPKFRFRHPEDAEEQVRLAVEYHEKKFGVKPEGMWPSEGSVSEELLPILAKYGIKWIASDEGNLKNSPGNFNPAAEQLFCPYQLNHSISMIFRNHFISDQVGFVYQSWRAEDAVANFFSHLRNIEQSLPQNGHYLVPVILDGENAWEYYQNGGKEFFETLYAGMENSPIKGVTVAEYLKRHPAEKKIKRLFAGSWIGSNFAVWIGHQEDNLAWDYLYQAKNELEKSEKKDNPVARRELFIAEGSDWCWWYGDQHSSENDAVFDELFRKHLKNIYLSIGEPPPHYLDLPIKRVTEVKPLREPSFLIHPVLDGEMPFYYEWLSAGCYDIRRAGGAMHQAATMMRRIYYGFDLSNLYLQFVVDLDLFGEEAGEFSFVAATFSPGEYKAQIMMKEGRYVFELFRHEGEGKKRWKSVKKLDSFGVKHIIEFGIPFEDLGVKGGDRIEFAVMIYKGNLELERWPKSGMITVTAPKEGYELEQWIV